MNRVGSSGVLDSSFDPDNFVITSTARWITGLWIGSLVLSLFVSLNAILAQQWVEEFNSRMESTAASNRRWAWRHMYFTQGVEDWNLDLFIASLPLLLHVSLLLFFVGLVLFWFPMDELVAVLLIGISVFSILFYFGTTLAPLIWPDCPTSTPLVSRIHKFWSSASRKFSSSEHAPDDAYDATGIDALVPMKNSPRLDAAALHWMLKVLPASGEVGIALDAIGSLSTKRHQKHFNPTIRLRPPSRGKLIKAAPQLSDKRRNALYSSVCAALRVQFQELSSYGDTVNSADIGRVLRTALFIDLNIKDLNRNVLTSWMKQHGEQHDINLLGQCLSEQPVSDTLAPLIPQIIEWYLVPAPDREDEVVPTVGPYLESTMELILAYAVRRKDPVYTAGREIYQPVVLLCSQILALPRGAAPRSSRHVPASALDILQQTVQRAIAARPPPSQKAIAVEKFDPPTDGFEPRALYIFGYLLRHITPNIFGFSKIDEPVLKMVNMAYRALLSLGGRSQIAYTLGEAQRALELIASSTFLSQKWTPAELGDASLVFSQAVQRAAEEETERFAKTEDDVSDDSTIGSQEEAKPPPQEWTQELTDIQHNMLKATLTYRKQKPGSATESELGAVVADCVTSFPSSCEAVAKRFLQYESLDDVMAHSRMQLLNRRAERDAKAGKGNSVWSLALRAGKAHRVEHRVAPLAQEMVVSLNALLLRGWDVADQVHEYLRSLQSPSSPSSEVPPVGGPSFDMLFHDCETSGAYDIARHLRAIYPTWWDATAIRLRTAREDEWVWDSKLKALSTRMDFIAQVESAPQCIDCLAHRPVPKPGELSRQMTPLPPLREDPVSMLPSIPETPTDIMSAPIPPPQRPALLSVQPAPAPAETQVPLPVITTSPPPEDEAPNDIDTRRRASVRRPRPDSEASDTPTYRYFFAGPSVGTALVEGPRSPILSESPIEDKSATRRSGGHSADLESHGNQRGW